MVCNAFKVGSFQRKRGFGDGNKKKSVVISRKLLKSFNADIFSITYFYYFTQLHTMTTYDGASIFAADKQT